MKLFKAATTVCGLAIMGALLSPTMKADDWNQKTLITFSGPVEIPGVHRTGWGILPAGTYVFKLMDSQSDRHIVQIFDKDETKVYATILAIPNYRLKPTDKTVITFSERPAGQPEALRAWFYPGANYGQEFVYPKAKATQLAQETHMVILAADIPAESPEPTVVAVEKAPVTAVKPTGEEVQLTEVITPVPQPKLPTTSSPVPALALFGFLALGSALAMRAFDKRAS
jgi:hypothetical protein